MTQAIEAVVVEVVVEVVVVVAVEAVVVVEVVVVVVVVVVGHPSLLLGRTLGRRPRQVGKALSPRSSCKKSRLVCAFAIKSSGRSGVDCSKSTQSVPTFLFV
jgi:hypothetical protein